MRRHLRWLGLLITLLFTPSAHAQISGSGGSSGTLGGTYIDWALPQNVVRFRFDAQYNDTVPDRAEFIYPQYQRQLNEKGQPESYIFDPKINAFREVEFNPAQRTNNFLLAKSQPQLYQYTFAGRGLPEVESRVDSQVGSAYVEWAPLPRLSTFVEMTVVGLNPEINSNTSGIGDTNAGFKYAFLLQDTRVASFQFRTYIPTGEPTRGLGTGHVSLEPALLFNQQVGARGALFGELRDWIPIGGSNRAGNVLRYGLGGAWKVIDTPNWWLAPAVEFVGWSVLSGEETIFVAPDIFDVRSARGDTIINGKVGLRLGLGARNQFSVSYGHALTSEAWYRDIFRLEYRRTF
jgi:hypothetical protein